MRTLPDDPSYYLIELSDFAQEPRPAPVRENAETFATILRWADDYLCAPHPELGRDGPVCPFVPSSLRNQTFFLTVYHSAPMTQADVYRTALRYRDWFLQIEPRSGPALRYKTILILFPDVPAADAPIIIDETQRQLKPHFVEHGLMVGQFHPFPPVDGGLWNPDFRPLRSPVPLLTIRVMLPLDLPFLVKDRRYVTAYLAAHGANVPRSQVTLLNELVQRYEIPIELPAPSDHRKQEA